MVMLFQSRARSIHSVTRHHGDLQCGFSTKAFAWNHDQCSSGYDRACSITCSSITCSFDHVPNNSLLSLDIMTTPDELSLQGSLFGSNTKIYQVFDLAHQNLSQSFKSVSEHQKYISCKFSAEYSWLSLARKTPQTIAYNKMRNYPKITVDYRSRGRIRMHQFVLDHRGSW